MRPAPPTSLPDASAFLLSLARRMADHGRVGRARGQGQITVERGPALVAAPLLEQLIAVRAPRLGRRVRVADRGRVALAGENAVAPAALQPPDLAFIIAKQAVPAVLGEVADDVEAGAGVVELHLVVEQGLAVVAQRPEVALAPALGGSGRRHLPRRRPEIDHSGLRRRVGLEQRVAPAIALAAHRRARLALLDQLLPGLRHGHRVVSGLADLEQADRIRLRFQLAAVVEEREDGPELGELDEIAGIEAAGRAADARAHGEEGEGRRLALQVPPKADLVATKEMAGLVGDDSGELGLVAHPEEETGEHD